MFRGTRGKPAEAFVVCCLRSATVFFCVCTVVLRACTAVYIIVIFEGLSETKFFGVPLAPKIML